MFVQTTELGRKVIGCAIEVHRTLGPGLLESTYENCLTQEFLLHGLTFERQFAIPVSYKGIELDCGYRIDFLVESKIVVELKTVERLLPIHKAQALTYLKILGVKQAFLINFNVRRLPEGLRSLLL